MSSNSAEHFPHADILLVDDEVKNLEFLIDVLTKEGFKVRPASDGELALRSALSKRPDIILLDIKMPGMDGIEVCRRLKADTKTSDIPIIFLTALGTTEVKVEALDSGGIDYITKPIEPAEVIARINTHLHISRLQQQLGAKNKELMVEINERRMAEEKAHSLGKVLEESLNEIYMFDAESLKFLHVNYGARRNLGYSQDELSYLTPLDIKPEFTSESFNKLIEPIRSGKKKNIQFTTAHKRKNGSQYPVEVHLQLSTFSSNKAFLAIILDITERIQAETKIHDSEELTMLLLNSMTEAIYGIDTSGKCTLANTSCISMLGYEDASELIGKDMHLLIHHTRPNGTPYPAEECHIYQAFRENKGTHADDEVLWRKDGSSFPASYWSHPVQKNGQIVGCVVTFLDISEQIVSRQALKQSHEHLRTALVGTIVAISRAIGARDPYTAGHQQRVSQLSRAIAQKMVLDSERIEGIRLGAIIHDIGKIHLPSEVLSKPTRLTLLELEYIKTHAQVGYDILKEIKFPWPVAQIAHQHHERLDGSGYPAGLKGDEICLEAQIVSVADVVEAMSSHRPYRPALGIEAALGEITSRSGLWFNPDAVEACLGLFREKRFSFEISPTNKRH